MVSRDTKNHPVASDDPFPKRNKAGAAQTGRHDCIIYSTSTLLRCFNFWASKIFCVLSKNQKLKNKTVVHTLVISGNLRLALTDMKRRMSLKERK